MTGPERIIITPRGASDPQTGEPPVDLLRAVTWLVLTGSVIGDLALAFQHAATPLRVGFAAVTLISLAGLAAMAAMAARR